jgi:deazaflavin-dependent oxidoreductase (nitroreductase family)
MFRLTTTGRRSGQPRSVILAYLEDGPNLCTLAMNGWGEGEPAWWLNLQANPDAHAVLPDGSRLVRGREAEGAERDRLWQHWREANADLDNFAALRPTPTAVVVLERRPG